ncbi:MAG: hypothetical protein HY399_08550, partial [Elusimicrobia bacterium]|nr:hypothetical protein [Elusimicrobiota bacterium]
MSAFLADSESPNDLFPISFATIRRDLNGQYWVGVFSLQEMTAKLNWIVSINGVRYFVKMEGTMVSFYLQEAPAGSPVPKFFSSPLQKPVKFSH